jgi:hypothetical protein
MDAALRPINCRACRSATGVIEHLGLEILELRQRVASLEADVVSYRELAQASLTMLYDITRERDQYRYRVFALVDEARAQRVELQHLAARVRALQHQDAAA